MNPGVEMGFESPPLRHSRPRTAVHRPSTFKSRVRFFNVRSTAKMRKPAMNTPNQTQLMCKLPSTTESPIKSKRKKTARIIKKALYSRCATVRQQKGTEDGFQSRNLGIKAGVCADHFSKSSPNRCRKKDSS